ncbi:MAG: hypothetical protein ABH804_03120 [archaeon]
MKKEVILFIFAIFLLSNISAEIKITQQIPEISNIGDTIQVPVIVKSSSAITSILKMNLICSGKEANFYTNGINLLSGEEKRIEASLILTNEQIENMRGACKIKAMILDDYDLSNEFKISDKISITTENLRVEFNPGEEIIAGGRAIKENGKNSNGFISIDLILKNSTSISQTESISNGYFSIKMKTLKNMKAGVYTVHLKAYEKDLWGQETNIGFSEYNIVISQIPTSLEIAFETKEVIPGTDLRVKSILHDQTGEKIKSTAIMTVKDYNNKILEQREISTDEYFELPIKHNEPPRDWTVVSVSNRLTAEAKFKITENKKVKLDIINSTLIITNIGNVPYNETVLVKISEQTINIKTNLKIDEVQKYSLTAPNGEYQVEVIADENSIISEQVLLTGKAISAEELSEGFVNIMRHPLSWIFIIIILFLTAFIIFKKGYNKSFIGKINLSGLRRNKEREINSKNPEGVKNRAELSLSIKGDKQDVSIICLKIKNSKEIESGEGNAKEAVNKLIDMSDEKKAFVYRNQEYLFFIFAPIRTKTFRNEDTAIHFAEKIKEELNHHNRLFKQKIKFGISVNYGAIVARQEQNVLKFMSMGTLVTSAKKISSLSEEEVLIGEKIRDKLGANIKTQKHEEGNTAYYKIKEIKNREEHKKFINEFVKKLEKKD